MRLTFLQQPLYDAEDGAGMGAPAAVVDAPPVDSGSLSDHEAAFSPDAQRAQREAPETDDEPAERDDRGQFKPRHRAASQRADVDDVPTINAHTKRIKDAEAKLGADIVKQDGESERAFNLRRRAEILERQATPVAVPKHEEPRAESVVAAAPPRPASEKFPAFEVWSEKPDNKDKDWNDYTDERVAHNYAVLREQERREDSAREAEQTARAQWQTYSDGFAAMRAEAPDFDTVLAALGPTDVSKVVEQATIAVGAKAAYYLAKHLDELRALTAETLTVSPENPAFAATVAATKRYLSTLVATQRTPPRTAAAPTGSAPAPDRPIAPRPPNPVRTGSIAEPDTPPDADDQSLSAHEKFFGPKRKRA